jgi:hypothetical protein
MMKESNFYVAVGGPSEICLFVNAEERSIRAMAHINPKVDCAKGRIAMKLNQDIEL